MQILFLNLYSGRVERGAESFTHQLAHKLSTHHQVNFIKGASADLPHSQFSGSILDRLLKRCFLDLPGRQVLHFSLSQARHIASSHYQLIVPLNGFWQLLILKLLQPFKGYKIVVIGNSGPGWDERWNLYLHPNAFIATTKPALDWARHTCPWTKSVLIPYAIDTKPFKTSPTKLNLPKPIILCPAALVPYKRIDLAIQAVSKLPQGSLLVLGKGPLRAQLSRLGRKLLPSRFKLISVSHNLMPSYYQAASVITLPSLSQENSPMVFLEALAAGRMVVTTKSPRHQWMLGPAGIFVDPVDTDQYSHALNQALQSHISTASALKKFTWSNVLTSYINLINTLVHD